MRRVRLTLGTRLRRILAWGLVTLAVMLASGLLLADRLTPRATGAPGHALPVQPAQTALDREIAPLVAKHGGKTGAILVPDGLDAFAARALSARQAGRSLDLMYYIWHDDLTGHLLGREVWQAAERGVRVRILLDDINAAGKDLLLLALDRHPNVEVRLYNPFRNRDGIGRLKEMALRFFSLNHRMHNKAWIADGRMAVVGGRNIGIEYFSASHASNFHDLDLVLFGPAVRQASAVFDDYWNSAAVVPVAALNRTPPPERVRALVQDVRAEADSAAARRYLARVEASPNVRGYAARTLQPIWSDRIEIVSDPPLKQADAAGAVLARRIAAELDGARRKALVISPYFVPGKSGTDALVALARRGVFTSVVTNSLAANDVAAVHGGYSRYRVPLLEGGVRLYEIRAQAGWSDGTASAGNDADGNARPRTRGVGGSGSGSGSAGGSSSGASLHTKAYVVDDARGFIGSFNMDPRSANLNTEMGVFFDDPRMGAALRTEYLHLAGPELSYWVYLDKAGDLRWLDRAATPPRVLEREPDAGLLRRAQAVLFRWLPVESQL